MAARGKKPAKKSAKKAMKKPVKKAAVKAKAAAKKPAAKKSVSPIPPGHPTVTPHLVIRNCASAIDWYKKAFGAVEQKRHLGPDGQSIMHATLKIGDTPVSVCDEYPMMQYWKAPESVGGTAVGMHIYVRDVDAAYKRALDAGATVMWPLNDTFWGDRYAQIKDPYGHVWSMATHKQDLTDAQVEEGAKAFFAQMAQEHGA